MDLCQQTTICSICHRKTDAEKVFLFPCNLYKKEAQAQQTLGK